MSANKSDVDKPCVVVDFHQQSVIITLDIENYPVIWENTRILVGILNVLWAFPLRPFCVLMPSTELLFAVCVCLPKSDSVDLAITLIRYYAMFPFREQRVVKHF